MKLRPVAAALRGLIFQQMGAPPPQEMGPPPQQPAAEQPPPTMLYPRPTSLKPALRADIWPASASAAAATSPRHALRPVEPAATPAATGCSSTAPSGSSGNHSSRTIAMPAFCAGITPISVPKYKPKPPPPKQLPTDGTAAAGSQDTWVNDNQWAMGGSLIANAGASPTTPMGIGGRSQRLLREGKVTREQLHAEWKKRAARVMEDAKPENQMFLTKMDEIRRGGSYLSPRAWKANMLEEGSEEQQALHAAREAREAEAKARAAAEAEAKAEALASRVAESAERLRARQAKQRQVHAARHGRWVEGRLQTGLTAVLDTSDAAVRRAVQLKHAGDMLREALANEFDLRLSKVGSEGGACHGASSRGAHAVGPGAAGLPARESGSERVQRRAAARLSAERKQAESQELAAMVAVIEHGTGARGKDGRGGASAAARGAPSGASSGGDRRAGGGGGGGSGASSVFGARNGTRGGSVVSPYPPSMDSAADASYSMLLPSAPVLGHARGFPSASCAPASPPTAAQAPPISDRGVGPPMAMAADALPPRPYSRPDSRTAAAMGAAPSQLRPATASGRLTTRAPKPAMQPDAVPSPRAVPGASPRGGGAASAAGATATGFSAASRADGSFRSSGALTERSSGGGREFAAGHAEGRRPRPRTAASTARTRQAQSPLLQSLPVRGQPGKRAQPPQGGLRGGTAADSRTAPPGGAEGLAPGVSPRRGACNGSPAVAPAEVFSNASCGGSMIQHADGSLYVWPASVAAW